MGDGTSNVLSAEVQIDNHCNIPDANGTSYVDAKIPAGAFIVFTYMCADDGPEAPCEDSVVDDISFDKDSGLGAHVHLESVGSLTYVVQLVIGQEIHLPSNGVVK